jgi:hypothetical protein
VLHGLAVRVGVHGDVTARTEFGFTEGFDSRIRSVSGVLRCADVDGSPDVLPWEYVLHGA